MSIRQFRFALVLLIFGNLIAVSSDALVKTAGQDTGVFQFLLYRVLGALLLLLPFWLTQKQKRPTRYRVHWFRGTNWVIGCACMVVALTSLPLATANALFYAAPMIMLPLAWLINRENISKKAGLSALVGFIGVLIIIRPNEINWGAMAALGCALSVALNNITVKKLPKGEPVLTTLIWTNLIALPLALLLAIINWHAFDWRIFLLATGSSFFILIYHAVCVVCYRIADASAIANAEYAGLIGAAVIGYIWFSEVPDMFTWLGSLLIVLPLILISIKPEVKKQSRVMPEKA